MWTSVVCVTSANIHNTAWNKNVGSVINIWCFFSLKSQIVFNVHVCTSVLDNNPFCIILCKQPVTLYTDNLQSLKYLKMNQWTQTKLTFLSLFHKLSNNINKTMFLCKSRFFFKLSKADSLKKVLYYNMFFYMIWSRSSCKSYFFSIDLK